MTLYDCFCDTVSSSYSWWHINECEHSPGKGESTGCRDLESLRNIHPLITQEQRYLLKQVEVVLNIFRTNMLNTGTLFLIYCLSVGEAFSTNSDATGKSSYQIQNGPCTYTFLLPELQNCGGPSSTYTNQVQRDDLVDNDSSVQRLEQLETIMENNTQWLQKVPSSSCTWQ